MKLLKWSEAQNEIKNHKGIIYLWFGTEWCSDCHMMLPIVEQVEQNFIGQPDIIFIKVDAEEAGIFRTNSPYKVLRVPTHVFIKNGDIKNIMYEYIPEEILINEIDKLRYEK